ncbi:MAG: glycoside hydrolase family 3 protein [Geobacteraceae bacterium]|nr:glycoside hydrolase family 3 protein [Geobacteraceae bacterium]
MSIFKRVFFIMHSAVRVLRHTLGTTPAAVFTAIPFLFLLVLLPGCGSDSPERESRVDKLLKSMSVEEKVGQIMVGFFRGATLSAEQQQRIRDLHLGGVILYSSSGNIEDTTQVADLVTSIQNTARDAGGIPLFVSIDQEGGWICRITQGVTVFPGNMALGAGGSRELSAHSADIMARELRALGITMNYAPVVDVNSNPANPIIGVRSFGSSPEDVARLGTAQIDPYRSAGVLCVAKHFPGHGDTDVDSHLGLPIVRHDRARLDAVELYPFKAMVAAGVPAVMTAHVEVPALDPSGLPGTLSAPILGVLRNEMGFDGLIITDSMGMGAIVQGWGLEEASILSFLAGTDILLFGADKGHEPSEQEGIHRALVAAVTSGRIPMERLDASVRRILTVKQNYGILDDPYPRVTWQASLASAEHTAVARRVADLGVTLVRNDRKLLPLTGTYSIPVLWPTEMKGYLQPLLAELPWLVPCYAPLQPAPEDTARVLETVRGAPAILVGSYNLSSNTGWRDLILSLGPENLVVAAMRSPYDLVHIPNVSAYLAVYSDRPVAMQALAGLLAGNRFPRGLLPVDLPGLYPRGWGMTTF